jgi:5-(carboxyamino)imidazole ribonucleotide synthase
VEMFVVSTAAGMDLLVNEMAPRPHNSGHWTLDASVTSQYEQQIRAICGVGLGDTSMTSAGVAMVNLLGELWPDGGQPDWSAALGDPSAKLHLYGKSEARPGRKMGHITVLADSSADAATRAVALRSAL